MYIPSHFREDDSERLAALIRDYAFGVLVTVEDGAPYASHLPFVFDATKGGKGTLTAHMARSNPQWRHFGNGAQALAIFQGPHTYISPAWYAASGVPTWNYAVVHVYGKPRVIDEPLEKRAIVERLTAINEAAYAPPWAPDFEDGRTARMLDAIVGFEIEVVDMQGKFKMSQNRPAEDRKRVVERLRASGSASDAAVADAVARNAEP